MSDNQHLRKEEIQELRKEFISPSLSVHYSAVLPLNIVRGRGQFLYDEKNQAYLDCINNVSTVGHCHPRVVEAFKSQITQLDSVPLSVPPNFATYTNHLLSHFPPSLNHVFYTSSGSEANDLALSVCRTVTGGEEVLVLNGAYHGHTIPLLGLSTYKAKQQTNAAVQWDPSAWPCSLPDSYRGKYRGQGAGLQYAKEVGQIIKDIRSQGKKVACFIAESFPGCAGQVKLPEDYLSSVFKLVHEAGGLCVMDEVQTGFGRSGEYFWIYESQGVCPDVVTIGKPMGNGHPISAVVTSADIAAKYLEAVGPMWRWQYCSDPVSLAVADAVLTVIEEEKLQENARELGDYVMGQLRLLMDKHQCIGDVRGYGLFIGMEIVKDRETREPDGDFCKQLVYKVLLDHHILIKEDGVDANVVKIKPPLVFTLQDAKNLIHAIDDSLTKLTSN